MGDQPLVTALAPRAAQSRDERAAFGGWATLIQSVMKTASGALTSKDGGALSRHFKDSQGKAERRYNLARVRAEREKEPKAKARWVRRAKRAKAQVETYRITNLLASRGVTGEGPVLEFKRNLLATEWEGSDEARQAFIESEIAAMDARLATLKKETDVLSKYGASMPQGPSAADLVAPSRHKVSKMMASGVGGLSFNAMAPPGPGRLVRIPLYPEQNGQSWMGANGIVNPGDDPVLNLFFGNGTRVTGPLRMITRRLEYGSYRVLGLQTNWQGTVRSSGPFNAQAGPPPAGNVPVQPYVGDVAITVSNLSLHNGAQLFLQLDEIDAGTFSIHPTGDMNQDFFGFGIESPFMYSRRRARQFSGLRDSPILDEDSTVTITVNAFLKAVLPVAPVFGGFNAGILQLPFSCNLVCEVLSDEVFGDPVNPSPAGRPGAMVKVAARDRGISAEGRRQLHIVQAASDPKRR